jgi:hypothetical protein
MKILAISHETPTVNWDAHEETLREEAAVLYRLYLDELVREFYFTNDGEAVLILEALTLGDAGELLEQLPLVRNGLIKFELMELHPYDGFKRLFKQQSA